MIVTNTTFLAAHNV